MFGLVIDTLKMLPNPGKRSLMKLMLNNLWGRFSLRNVGLWQTLLTTDMAVVGEYLDKHDVDVMALDMVDEDENGDGDVMMISYIMNKEYVEEHDCSNVGKSSSDKSDQFNSQFDFLSRFPVDRLGSKAHPSSIDAKDHKDTWLHPSIYR
jgi:hypothetical protein